MINSNLLRSYEKVYNESLNEAHGQEHDNDQYKINFFYILQNEIESNYTHIYSSVKKQILNTID